MSVFAERREVPLNGHLFYVAKMPPFEAIEALGTLQKRFAGPLADLMKARGIAEALKQGAGEQIAALAGTGQEGADAPADTAAAMLDTLAQAIKGLSERLDGPDLRKLATMLLNPAYVSVKFEGEGDAVRLDAGMVNRTLTGAADVMILCRAVLEENFADFFTKWRVLLGQAQ